MPQARYRLVDPRTTPYYHCISRCVRRAFLCGDDKWTGKNFDHRKQWLLDRIKLLSGVFAIDVCAYAIMSNHFHLVLHLDLGKARNWTPDEVMTRWLTLHKAPYLVQKHIDGELLTKMESEAVSSAIEIWRSRLADLSWYMRCLNESIARLANAEDECSGRFWEGRFKSQALLDEAALLSCMAYVDLNPIRAGMSETLQESEFTSIQERLKRYREGIPGTMHWLQPLKEAGKDADNFVPITQADYFELVEWTGRAVQGDNRGAIPQSVLPVLEQLGVNELNWVNNTQHFELRFRRGLGKLGQLQRFASRMGQRWIQGQAQAVTFYS